MQYQKQNFKDEKLKKEIIWGLEFEEKILEIKRVTKIVKGGRNMSYRALIVLGDKTRRVGLGVGRADDVNLAIQKAVINAKKNIVCISLTKTSSIPHIICQKYGTSKIILIPAKKGTGIIAGGALKAVLEMSGVNNIVAKQLGSRNILNNARATIKALTTIKDTISNSIELLTKNNIFYKRALKRFEFENNG
jgi:small subunit ribosomal protein S5